MNVCIVSISQFAIRFLLLILFYDLVRSQVKVTCPLCNVKMASSKLLSTPLFLKAGASCLVSALSFISNFYS